MCERLETWRCRNMENVLETDEYPCSIYFPSLILKQTVLFCLFRQNKTEVRKTWDDQVCFKSFQQCGLSPFFAKQKAVRWFHHNEELQIKSNVLSKMCFILWFAEKGGWEENEPVTLIIRSIFTTLLNKWMVNNRKTECIKHLSQSRLRCCFTFQQVKH